MWNYAMAIMVGGGVAAIFMLIFSAENFLNWPSGILSVWFGIFATIWSIKYFSQFGDDLRSNLLGKDN